MRQGGGPNGRRPRGRHHGGGGHGGGHDRSNGNSGGGHNHNRGGGDNRPRSAASLRHQTFDSNCIDVRVRGNAWQVHEKYQALARDAQSGGDRVAAEHYLQHAEHYYRIIEAINEATAAEQQARPQQQQPNAPYGQQPEVPSNYYGASGNPQPAQPPGAPGSEAAGNVAPMPAQAEVQQRNAPQKGQDPFFTPEDTDDQSAPQPLVASR
ncbi:MAG: DUF4167 domain-containing protein [Alphaproteobacteria bacterium]